MPLNIKSPEVERLVDEVAAPADEAKTEVVRYLEREVWPKVPSELLGRGLTKEEQEEILGYGPEGD